MMLNLRLTLRIEIWLFFGLLCTSALMTIYINGKSMFGHHHKTPRHQLTFRNQPIASISVTDNKNQGREKAQTEKDPILTLFTTWHPSDKKFLVRNNTLKNWALFKPYIKPVLFYSNDANTSYFNSFGWDVLPITKTSVGDLPVLKYMFLEVLSKYKSLFYAYANGDILFDIGLLKTIRKLARQSLISEKPVLVIGRRTNVLNVSSSESIDTDKLSYSAKNRGKLFPPFALDYFITDSSFPWTEIPELVIGRVAYDNWLVLNSCKHKHHVIDATKTLLAVHQTTQDGNFEGRHKKDTFFNTNLLKRLKESINFKAGRTVCAPLFTETTKEKVSGNDIKISKRLNLPEYCYPY